MKRIIAIARNESFFLADSDTNLIGYPSRLQHFKIVLEEAEEKLKKKIKLNLKAYKDHITILKNEIKEIKENFYLELSRELLESNDIIVLEEVGIDEKDIDWLESI